ncbi:ROK family transcriptional regulator [Streptomyces spongiae]|uniref:ROK family transcriptional regulator n=1 Tax=Streptomyces spongiae TaxID=565072 RepID=A0A5N8XT56_9ACTN|nr:ROK family transcriptional regulator [Streptomyces spongiae]MPY62549.1 ROK family transcriptional regulator [Streptomyces spongiae]
MRDSDGYATDPALLPAVPAGLRRVLDLVVSGEATSRAEIARRSGLARSTVGQQVDHLVAGGILQEIEAQKSVRGRPPRVLTLGPQAGTIAVADVDALASRVAIADLTGRILAQDIADVRVDAGPEAVLGAVSERLLHLLERTGRGPDRVRQVVVGLPGPVDFQRGCAVRPNGMPGWDGYPAVEFLSERFRAPALVDNDANLMALGEAVQEQGDTPLLCIKIGTGIGAGFVSATGEVYRGADGAAGDVGHIRAAGGSDALCTCGNVGCVRALASHRAVLQQLGIPESTDEDPLHGEHELVRRVANNDPHAVRALRQAATEIGELLAMLVYVFNPRRLVLGGPLSELGDDLLSGVRAVVYQRALPLATRDLTITTTQLGSGSALHGAIALATRDVFSATGIARMLADDVEDVPVGS